MPRKITGFSVSSVRAQHLGYWQASNLFQMSELFLITAAKYALFMKSNKLFVAFIASGNKFVSKY